MSTQFVIGLTIGILLGILISYFMVGQFVLPLIIK